MFLRISLPEAHQVVTGAHPCSCAVSVVTTGAWARLWERALASSCGFPPLCHQTLSWSDKERVLTTAVKIALLTFQSLASCSCQAYLPALPLAPDFKSYDIAWTMDPQQMETL